MDQRKSVRLLKFHGSLLFGAVPAALPSGGCYRIPGISGVGWPAGEGTGKRARIRRLRARRAFRSGRLPFGLIRQLGALFLREERQRILRIPLRGAGHHADVAAVPADQNRGRQADDHADLPQPLERRRAGVGIKR